MSYSCPLNVNNSNCELMCVQDRSSTAATLTVISNPPNSTHAQHCTTRPQSITPEPPKLTPKLSLHATKPTDEASHAHINTHTIPYSKCSHRSKNQWPLCHDQNPKRNDRWFPRHNSGRIQTHHKQSARPNSSMEIMVSVYTVFTYKFCSIYIAWFQKMFLQIICIVCRSVYVQNFSVVYT